MAKINYVANNKRKSVSVPTGQVQEVVLRFESYGFRIISVKEVK